MAAQMQNEKKIGDLFKALEKEFSFSVNSLKESIGSVFDKIENQIQYIKDEIDVRIESIKTELDSLGDLLKNDLDENKKQLVHRVDWVDYNEYEKDIEILHDIIDSEKHGQKMNILEKFQENLAYLNKTIEYVNNFDCQITFNINQSKIEQTIIGSIMYNYRHNDEIKCLNNRIKSCDYRKMPNKSQNNTDISGLCALPNGHLLSLNFLRRSLTLYNTEFEIVKEIHRDHGIFEKICDVSCATTNNLDKIYITDNNMVVIVTDFDFNLIKSIGTKDPNPKQFYNHRSICFFNNSVYVCDTRNQKIQKMTDCLELEAVYPLEFCPVQIKISNSIACIVPSILDECESVYFFDIDSFNLKFKYEGHYGMIELVNSYFYEFCDENRKIYCYDQNGVLFDEIQTYFEQNQYDCFNAIAYFDEKLVLYSEPNFILI